MKLHLFGKLSIVEQLDEGYQIARRKHQKEVTKNPQHILSRIIDGVKLALSWLCVPMIRVQNPGIFCGLVDSIVSLLKKLCVVYNMYIDIMFLNIFTIFDPCDPIPLPIRQKFFTTSHQC